ncbi:Uncharacterised protein [Nocardia farcinica]|nr:Uncharacterised protein [Nocardia farcinica]
MLSEHENPTRDQRPVRLRTGTSRVGNGAESVGRYHRIDARVSNIEVLHVTQTELHREILAVRTLSSDIEDTLGDVDADDPFHLAAIAGQVQPSAYGKFKDPSPGMTHGPTTRVTEHKSLERADLAVITCGVSVENRGDAVDARLLHDASVRWSVG